MSLEQKIEQFYNDTVETCEQVLASLPNPEAAKFTPKELAAERVRQVREALANGFDCGGIVKDVVKVDDIRSEPHLGWVYVTKNGLYAISWRPQL